MIDIHCHILPGVDDGVRTMEEALAMARKEVEGGTRGFFATSHVMEKHDIDSLAWRAELLLDLRGEMASVGIAAEVYAGAEVYPFVGALKALEAGLPISMGGGGKYVLVDLPLSQFPNDLESFLFEIQALGATPILAHPERTAPVQSDPEILRPMLGRGVVLQVNAGSVLGQYGPVAVRTAHLIMRRRWAHFLASDSHRPATSPKLSRGVDVLSDTLDEAYLTLLTRTSPQAVLDGIPLPPLPPAPPEQKRRLWPWSRR